MEPNEIVDVWSPREVRARAAAREQIVFPRLYPPLEGPSGTRPMSYDSLSFVVGGGEMGERIRALDWSSTALGPLPDWPQGLKTATRIMLTSRQPIWIGWGGDLLKLYNDPYKAIIGGKHPWALGRPAREVWREIWPNIGPMLATAMGGDEGTYVEAQLLIMERSGYPEETYYTFSYSPIPDDQGRPGGIICANTDDTRRVIGERQLGLLREIAAAGAESRTLRQVYEQTARALATNQRDLPFASIYFAEPDGKGLSLVGWTPLGYRHPAFPQRVTAGDTATWPLAEVISDQTPRVLDDLEARFGSSFPKGAWDKGPQQAALIPIPARGETGRHGVLVAGLNPFRQFDDAYRGFLTLVAGEIAASLANAQAYEDERRRAEALAEIDRAKTLFFSNISHEFRTPLTLMLSPLEEILGKPPKRCFQTTGHWSRSRTEIRCGCSSLSTRCSISRASRPDERRQCISPPTWPPSRTSSPVTSSRPARAPACISSSTVRHLRSALTSIATCGRRSCSIFFPMLSSSPSRARSRCDCVRLTARSS